MWTEEIINKRLRRKFFPNQIGNIIKTDRRRML